LSTEKLYLVIKREVLSSQIVLLSTASENLLSVTTNKEPFHQDHEKDLSDRKSPQDGKKCQGKVPETALLPAACWADFRATAQLLNPSSSFM